MGGFRTSTESGSLMARNRVWQMDVMDAHRAGRITDEQLHSVQRIGRRVVMMLHSCGEHVLTGLDDEPCGMTVRVDPYPLSPTGEVAALRAGRRTYWLRHGSLERRDQWNIPGHPPAPDLLVLAEHRCGDRPPDDWLAPPSPRPPRPAPEEF
jgi:hypothetical protein